MNDVTGLHSSIRDSEIGSAAHDHDSRRDAESSDHGA